MQTNREDVGKRYLEISIPVPKNADVGKNASESFRDYYKAISSARSNLSKYLDADSEHHFFVSGAEPDEEGAAALAGVDLDQDSTVPAVEDES
jgi:type I restriction enzyme M protein